MFDWDKAARLIRERNMAVAHAGLQHDLDWTGGVILKDGEPVPAAKTYTYLASNWAIPVLYAHEGEHETECWAWQEDTPGWDAHTYWPASARAILKGDTE